MRAYEILLEKILVGNISDKYYVYQPIKKDKIYLFQPDELFGDGFVKTVHGASRPDIFIDIDKKLVDLMFSQKYSNDRITNLQQSGFYVYPKSQAVFNTKHNSQTDLFQILKELSNRDNRLLQCIIKTDEDYNGATVEQFLSRGRNSDNVLSPDQPIYGYHGTSKKRYDQIKKNGLVTGQREDAYVDLVKGYSENNIYLSFSIIDARKYAARQSGSDRSEACVLKVKITDKTKIRPDEDMVMGWTENLKNNEKFQNYIKNIIGVERYERISGYNVHSSHIMLGKNPHKNSFISDELYKTKIHPFLIKHLMSNGAKYHFTFAYNGNIKPSDIKLVETFKPVRVKKDPSNDEWNAAYQKTNATLKGSI